MRSLCQDCAQFLGLCSHHVPRPSSTASSLLFHSRYLGGHDGIYLVALEDVTHVVHLWMLIYQSKPFAEFKHLFPIFSPDIVHFRQDFNNLNLLSFRWVSVSFKGLGTSREYSRRPQPLKPCRRSHVCCCSVAIGSFQTSFLTMQWRIRRKSLHLLAIACHACTSLSRAPLQSLQVRQMLSRADSCMRDRAGRLKTPRPIHGPRELNLSRKEIMGIVLLIATVRHNESRTPPSCIGCMQMTSVVDVRSLRTRYTP